MTHMSPDMLHLNRRGKNLLISRIVFNVYGELHNTQYSKLDTYNHVHTPSPYLMHNNRNTNTDKIHYSHRPNNNNNTYMYTRSTQPQVPNMSHYHRPILPTRSDKINRYHMQIDNRVYRTALSPPPPLSNQFLISNIKWPFQKRT